MNTNLDKNNDRKKWFEWYGKQLDKQKEFIKINDVYICPCCFMPTLSERARYEICPICFWEDDGQDSDDSEIIRGGPNGKYSLRQARDNFIDHFTMYDKNDLKPFEKQMQTEEIRNDLYVCYSKALNTKAREDWDIAVGKLKEYYEKRTSG